MMIAVVRWIVLPVASPPDVWSRDYRRFVGCVVVQSFTEYNDGHWHFQMFVFSCLSTNVCFQMFVFKCLFSNVCFQMFVFKCLSSNVCFQMFVFKCLFSNVCFQFFVLKCLSSNVCPLLLKMCLFDQSAMFRWCQRDYTDVLPRA